MFCIIQSTKVLGQHLVVKGGGKGEEKNTTRVYMINEVIQGLR